VFLHGRPFQPGLMLVGEAKSLRLMGAMVVIYEINQIAFYSIRLAYIATVLIYRVSDAKPVKGLIVHK
jgi:hypothetical protein